jgi:predicted metal-dependent hydrolase
MKNYELIYKNKKINCFIVRKNVKNINMRIKPSLEVTISANKSVSEKYIIEMINNKSEWIYKHILEFEKKGCVPRYDKLINGEVVKYLGKKYLLEIIDGDINNVIRYDNKIVIIVNNKDNNLLIKEVFDNWLKIKAREIFTEALDEMYKKMKNYDIIYPKMTIRKMKTRWGSCSVNKAKISINSNLIYEPIKSIKYVILHELAHFVYPNHSNDFYKILKENMVDFKEIENNLNGKI